MNAGGAPSISVKHGQLNNGGPPLYDGATTCVLLVVHVPADRFLPEQTQSNSSTSEKY